MRTRVLVVAAAGLLCGFTATPVYERKAGETVSRSIAVATQECWGKLKSKAQVGWYGHLRTIDEPARGDAVMTWTARSVARCVATDTGSQEHDPSTRRIVDAFMKQCFRVP
jgi:hypothetical protein